MSQKNEALRDKRTKTFPAIEHRAFVRHECREEGSCHSVQPGAKEVWPATVRDVSVSGLSLVVRHEFAKGEILVVELEKPVEGFPRRLFMRVKHATKYADHSWIVGCCFVNKLTDYELQALI